MALPFSDTVDRTLERLRTAFIDTAGSASLSTSTGVALAINCLPAMNSGGALTASLLMGMGRLNNQLNQSILALLALAERDVNMKKLWHYARLCRVERVMKPYVDALATR